VKIEIYGPEPEYDHMLGLLKAIPQGAKHVVVQAPLRRASDLKLCQRPDTLEYAASVDGQTFIYYSHHPAKGATIIVKT
jgi:hypothetical protein